MKDTFFIKKTIELAKKGLGETSPNPCVGAILVKNGKIIGKGWHKKAGGPHAEIIAIDDCGKRGEKTEGSTLYVSLSPCCHYGKTGPCTEAIIDAKISKVVAAMSDPNPLCHNTTTIFKKHNIEYTVGIMEQQARELNAPYLKYITTGLPYITLKMALSLNEKISGQQGPYITCFESRKYVHKLRRNVDAVLVGINTILADNPHLNVRHVKGKNPKKIILDSSLKIHFDSAVLRDGNALIITTKKTSEKQKNLLSKKAEIIVVENIKNLKKILTLLADTGIRHILVEGGKKVAESFLQHQIVDKMVVFIAPIIIKKGIDFSLASLKWKEKKIKKIGTDILWEGSLFPKNKTDEKKIKKSREKNRNKKRNHER
ncbi:bifunctional diaminohydroxyphosphoribosylaminopyrimidine deaminase/5-amino-6-(5-phosphoribosylamino)uracil reductase RibD [Candidatus Peregrinibacteria bacterium]|nr:bifunctional diaminohydroxyphosphoribosylaminopyrimidine deaminase/5-amino-6-(5-phosphoribosylamino)uracil reductase RibD [Candidatus Peregrinibacteria bacterium]